MNRKKKVGLYPQMSTSCCRKWSQRNKIKRSGGVLSTPRRVSFPSSPVRVLTTLAKSGRKISGAGLKAAIFVLRWRG
jgi:hypothetical protein